MRFSYFLCFLKFQIVIKYTNGDIKDIKWFDVEYVIAKHEQHYYKILFNDWNKLHIHRQTIEFSVYRNNRLLFLHCENNTLIFIQRENKNLWRYYYHSMDKTHCFTVNKVKKNKKNKEDSFKLKWHVLG